MKLWVDIISIGKIIFKDSRTITKDETEAMRQYYKRKYVIVEEVEG